MTIEQTVEVPADHRLFLDLPFTFPAGRAKITITPEFDKLGSSAYEVIENLRGLAKEMGSTLSVNRFLKMRKEDLELEAIEQKENIHFFWLPPHPKTK
jgi:hypothetical protein